MKTTRDVLHLMPALEKHGATRSVNHYRKVLSQRLDKEKGALFAFREKDLLPESLIGPWLDSEVQQTPSPMRDNIKNREKLLREQYRERLEANGRDIGDLLDNIEEPDMPALDELPEFMEKMERQAQQIQADAEQRKREMEAKYPHRDDQMPRGPESLHRMQEMLHRNSDLMSEKKRQQASEALHQMYLAAVSQQPPAVRLTGDLAQIIRQRAGRTLAQGGILAVWISLARTFPVWISAARISQRRCWNVLIFATVSWMTPVLPGRCLPVRNLSAPHYNDVILPGRAWRLLSVRRAILAVHALKRRRHKMPYSRRASSITPAWMDCCCAKPG
jgi:hypothetical protein